MDNTKAETIDYLDMVERTKKLTGFNADHESLLVEVRNEIQPFLGAVTEGFYATLLSIPETAAFLEGRTDSLKNTHKRWLESLFTGPFDAEYAKNMYHVGTVHVAVKLPVEFMQGTATLILGELIKVITQTNQDNPARLGAIINAVNAVIGFSVAIMQESYQASSLSEELEKFLAITGMTRNLFNNLALAYENK